MSVGNYWIECLAEAARECGLMLTDSQIDFLAGAAESAHENYGMAFGRPESSYPSEIAQLKQDLEIERNKIICPQCKGRGVEIIGGPCHASMSQCRKCRGEGKIIP